MAITVGVQLAPQYGDMRKLREAWIEAEALGADILWTCDHFHAQIVSPEAAQGAHTEVAHQAKNFESTTVQAAMAATTTRAYRLCCTCEQLSQSESDGRYCANN